MRRHGNYQSSSSIALLQERFRNLQKVKEMREGREQQQQQHLLQMMLTSATTSSSLPAAPAAASSSSSEQPRWFSHPELLRPSSRRPVHGAAESSLPPAAVDVARVQSSGCSRSDPEVDTSLHL